MRPRSRRHRAQPRRSPHRARPRGTRCRRNPGRHRALLTTDGYAIVTARDEDDAVARARRRRPDLILVSFEGVAVDVILSAARIRQRAGLGNIVPVVIFCVPIIDEGAEVALGNNVYITRPDNFDQLRGFIARLLSPAKPPPATLRIVDRTRSRRSDSTRRPRLPDRRD